MKRISDLCTHEEVEIELQIEDHMGFDGHYQTEREVYVCVDCGEFVDGSPEQDRSEAVVDMQIMEVLEK